MIRPDGLPFLPADVDEEEEYSLAILEDDRVVKIVAYLRVKVSDPCISSAATERYFWDEEEQYPKGFHGLILNLKESIERAVERRKARRKPYKAWLRNFEFLGPQLIWDRELLDEIMETGIDKWLDSYDEGP